MPKIINTDSKSIVIVLVTREVVQLAPGEVLEFEGDVELVE
jgi:hypothetical protein